MQVLAFLGGLFSLCGAIFDWDLFFSSYKAQPFVKLFGRDGARIFYAVLGIFIMILSFFIRR